MGLDPSYCFSTPDCRNLRTQNMVVWTFYLLMWDYQLQQRTRCPAASGRLLEPMVCSLKNSLLWYMSRWFPVFMHRRVQGLSMQQMTSITIIRWLPSVLEREEAGIRVDMSLPAGFFIWPFLSWCPCSYISMIGLGGLTCQSLHAVDLNRNNAFSSCAGLTTSRRIRQIEQQ